jgi:aminoglycoside 6'-N-acetyltransferase
MDLQVCRTVRREPTAIYVLEESPASHAPAREVAQMLWLTALKTPYGRAVRAPATPLVGALTTIRSATPGDVNLLVRWHSDPDVARYWDGKTFTREQMLIRLARPDVDPYVVLRDGEPVGYLQVRFDDGPAGDGGVDMFLIPAARGRGLGPDAARTMADWLLETGVLRRLTVNLTSRTNEQSRRGRRRAFSQSRNMNPMKSTLFPGC